MKKIQLTQGQVALVDDVDFARFGHLNWYALKKRSGFYAARKSPRSEGHKTIYLHRAIKGDPLEMLVDHKNHGTLDDRRHNLRVCTSLQNIRNRKGRQSNSTTGIRGVTRHTQTRKYVAQIRTHGKHIHLGCFTSKAKAAAAYAIANRALFGEFGGRLLEAKEAA